MSMPKVNPFGKELQESTGQVSEWQKATVWSFRVYSLLRSFGHGKSQNKKLPVDRQLEVEQRLGRYLCAAEQRPILGASAGKPLVAGMAADSIWTGDRRDKSRNSRQRGQKLLGEKLQTLFQ